MHYLPCFLMSVYIVRELRGQGFGRQLMMKTEEFCHNKGMQHCYLGTTPDIAPMYLKFGYEFCDWRIQTIGSGVSMIPMWCACDIHVVCMWYPFEIWSFVIGGFKQLALEKVFMGGLGAFTVKGGTGMSGGQDLLFNPLPPFSPQLQKLDSLPPCHFAP